MWEIEIVHMVADVVSQNVIQHNLHQNCVPIKKKKQKKNT